MAVWLHEFAHLGSFIFRSWTNSKFKKRVTYTCMTQLCYGEQKLATSALCCVLRVTGRFWTQHGWGRRHEASLSCITYCFNDGVYVHSQMKRIWKLERSMHSICVAKTGSPTVCQLASFEAEMSRGSSQIWALCFKSAKVSVFACVHVRGCVVWHFYFRTSSFCTCKFAHK